MHQQYEEWLKQQEIYKTLVYQHGDQTLIRENGQYKILAVRLGWELWQLKAEVKPCNQGN